MARRPAQSVLSLDGAVLTERSTSLAPAQIDLDLRRGEVDMIHVDDDREAAELVDLCVGQPALASGHVRFLGVDWAASSRSQQLHDRRRIGLVVQTEVWPAQMSVMEAVLLSRLYHYGAARIDLVTEAIELARLFGLPGLPVERRDAVASDVLLRAGCVRGLLGGPDLVLVHDQALDRASELAIPMAQAIASIRGRGGAVLWITAAAVARAAQFVDIDRVFRLGGTGLIRMRRPR